MIHRRGAEGAKSEQSTLGEPHWGSGVATLGALTERLAVSARRGFGLVQSNRLLARRMLERKKHFRPCGPPVENGEQVMSSEDVIANQKMILENQQSILGNQQAIQDNQAKLDAILANQQAIQANQEKILANQEKILSK